jgi:hypothetical protein
MLPSSPADLIWRVVAPLVQQLEAINRLLEACAAYYAWCAGCAARTALLLIGGLVLSEGSDVPDAPTEPERSATPDRATWADRLPTGGVSRFRDWANEHLRRLSIPPVEPPSAES